MPNSLLLSALAALALASTTVLAECSNHSFTTCADGITHWYDPATGEICDPLDCGGGRAPPKTDVPGCPQYKGTATRPTSASYLSCWTPSSSLTKAAAPTTQPAGSTTTTTGSVGGTGGGSSASPVSTALSSGSSTTTPSTTAAASLTPKPSGSSSSSSSTTSSTASKATSNAGSFVGGSLMAVAGAALGAIALL